MLKRYIANTILRICVGDRAFTFETYTDGQSYYETSDENIQKLLESHQEFRHAFDLDATLLASQEMIAAEAEKRRQEIEEKRKRIEEKNLKAQQQQLAEMNHQSSGMEEKPEENVPTKELEVTDDGFTVVEAASTTDAKEYLHRTYGIQKTRMLRKNDLLDRAQELKIKFVGKDFK